MILMTGGVEDENNRREQGNIYTIKRDTTDNNNVGIPHSRTIGPNTAAAANINPGSDELAEQQLRDAYLAFQLAQNKAAGTPIYPVPDQAPQEHPDSNRLDKYGILQIYPNASTPRVEYVFDKGEGIFTRHYASNKPDDPSIEFTNTVKTAFINAEVTMFVLLKGMVHPDTLSLKCKGGVHTSGNNGMDGRCYIFLYPTAGGSKPTLQKEWPHPHNRDVNPAAVTNIPFDLNNKILGLKAIYYNIPGTDTVHLESLINIDGWDFDNNKPVSNVWHPHWMAVDHGQMYNTPIITPIGKRTTLRIDGVKNIPVVVGQSIREIDPTVSNAKLHEAVMALSPKSTGVTIK